MPTERIGAHSSSEIYSARAEQAIIPSRRGLTSVATSRPEGRGEFPVGAFAVWRDPDGNLIELASYANESAAQ